VAKKASPYATANGNAKCPWLVSVATTKAFLPGSTHVGRPSWAPLSPTRCVFPWTLPFRQLGASLGGPLFRQLGASFRGRSPFRNSGAHGGTPLQLFCGDLRPSPSTTGRNYHWPFVSLSNCHLANESPPIQSCVGSRAQDSRGSCDAR